MQQGMRQEVCCLICLAACPTPQPAITITRRKRRTQATVAVDRGAVCCITTLMATRNSHTHTIVLHLSHTHRCAPPIPYTVTQHPQKLKQFLLATYACMQYAMKPPNADFLKDSQ